MKVLEDTGVGVNFGADDTEEEKLGKTVLVIKRSIEVKRDVKELVTKLEDLKMCEKKVEKEAANVDEDTVIMLARSVRGITDQLDYLVYQYEQHKVKCECGTTFKYKEDEEDFNKAKLSKKFTNLKKILRHHISVESHKKKMREREEEMEEEEKEESRNTKIGRGIVGVIYHLLRNARPDGDLPLLIYRMQQAGGDVGDINHSSNLVKALLPEIAAVVEGRVRRFLSTRMVATGQLTPVNVMADKATDKR